MDIAKKALAGIPLLEVDGDIDHAFAEAFDRAVRDCLNGGNRLLLDLTRCSYIDSGGLAVLLHLTRRLPPGGWLGVVAANNNILRLFEIVALDAYPGFRLFKDLADASESLKAEGN